MKLIDCKFQVPIVLVFLILLVNKSQGRTGKELIDQIKKTEGQVALWNFREKEGKVRKAYGEGKFPLKECGGTVPRINEGPLSGYSALFGNKAYLCLPNEKTASLNIYCKQQGVTVMAWVKWKGNIEFVGGMWNEYQDGGKRQYGLFPCRIITAAIRFAVIYPKPENQRRRSLFQSIIRQASNS